MTFTTTRMCPAKDGDCDVVHQCEAARLCRHFLVAPIKSLHFVGFTDPQRYENAVLVFGQPDFVHRIWDYRAKVEVVEGDAAVFAKYDPETTPCVYSWDDSNQPDDPAAKERQ